MSKLIIQIPCLNEETSLPVTLAALPRHVPGVDTIEVMVINDGSTDNTVAVARQHGAQHVLDFKRNRGLAHAFTSGILEAARLGADYVVNLDADNQYNAQDIPLLLAPILSGEADMTVGERPIGDIAHFSKVKKILQRLGSGMVRRLSRTPVRDTPSGFRALNRRAMLGLFIFNQYTYTHESLIAAQQMDLRVVGVPIRVNPGVMRQSRLMKSTFQYLVKSGGTILRFAVLYNPMPLFLGIFAVTGLAGLGLGGLFLRSWLGGGGLHDTPLLMGSTVLLTTSLLAIMMSVLSDSLRINRKLLQKILAEQREHHLRQEDTSG